MKKSKFFLTAIPSRWLFFGLALFILIALFLWQNFYGTKVAQFKTKLIPEAIKKLTGSNSQVSIDNIKEVSGVYQFDLTLGEGANARKYISYITKDGKVLFTSGIKLDTLTQGATTTQTQTKKLTCNDVNKADKAVISAFVVSNCPYGLQMQRLMKKAIGELSLLNDYLNVKYIGSVNDGKITSMHGEKEATENLKQICIREEQPEKYWPYLTCYMQEGKSDECNGIAGVDNISLQGCLDDKSRGLSYAQKDFELANKYGIGSSPTLLVNDKQVISEFDFGGRTANSLKDIVCCASANKPDFCSSNLSKDEVATSFSLTDSASASDSSGANCGTQ